ncbi:MAG: hypothetical protein WC492_04845 [Candidatus Micrarchaeia archaeon]
MAEQKEEQKHAVWQKTAEQNEKKDGKKNLDQNIDEQIQMQKLPEQKIEPLRKIYEMGFWLDDYDEIFSDFDPRTYSKRQLSEDFLAELKRRYKETPTGGFEVSLYLPKGIRDVKIESAAKKKIREYFANEMKRLEEKSSQRKKTGLMYLAAGMIILSLHAMLVWSSSASKLVEIIGFILVPAGWFSVWTSIENLVQESAEIKGQKEYYAQMSKCNYLFVDLEMAEGELTKQAIHRHAKEAMQA